MSDELVTLQEAAELIGKNLRTIQRYIKAGKLRRHQKDGKNFVSRSELETKFKMSATKPPESVASEKIADASESRQIPKVEDYQKKWIEEIQKHAQTREELGIWKGRAEAYQAFASRLLGTGAGGGNAPVDLEPKVDLEPNPSEIKKGEPMVRSPQISYSLIYYIAFAVLFVILILLFVLIRISTS